MKVSISKCEGLETWWGDRKWRRVSVRNGGGGREGCSGGHGWGGEGVERGVGTRVGGGADSLNKLICH